MKARSNGIIKATPAADYSSHEGYGMTLAVASNVLTATVSASASVRIKGIVTEAGTVAQGVSLAVPGNCPGGVHVKLGGTVAAGAFIQQHTDGTFITDAETGARVIVGIALEGGVAGDLVEALLQTPVTLS